MQSIPLHFGPIIFWITIILCAGERVRLMTALPEPVRWDNNLPQLDVMQPGSVITAQTFYTMHLSQHITDQ